MSYRQLTGLNLQKNHAKFETVEKSINAVKVHRRVHQILQWVTGAIAEIAE